MMKVSSSSSSEGTPIPQVNSHSLASQEEGVHRLRSGSVDTAPPVQALSIHEREAALLSALLDKAEAGDIEAQFELADKYYSCPEADRDYKLARKWFRAAADQDHKEAHLKLGEIYFEGHGTAQNYDRAIKHFQKASYLGEITSRFRIADMYEHGLGVEQNYMLAFFWNTRATSRVGDDTENGKQRSAARNRIENKIKEELLGGDNSEKNLLRHAKKGLVEAQYFLACFYERAEKVKESLKWYQKVAERMQEADIYFDMSKRYMNGDGIKPNKKKGNGFLLKAANLGHVGALMMLALLLKRKGKVEEAHAFLLQAAQRGDKEAQSEVGYMYVNGTRVPLNAEEGLKWLRQSASQGYVCAQHNLGEIYERGLVGPINFVEARRWYQLAAAQGFLPSIGNLAVFYYQGKGGPVDKAEALKLYKLVGATWINGGRSHMDLDSEFVASARYMVGRMLFEGQGAPVDEVEGIKWIKLARELGYQGAHDFLAEKGL